MSQIEAKVVKADFKKLNAFVKSLSAGLVVKVGILGKKSARTSGPGMSNADIGYIHEFGCGVPRRSFLRMPLFVKSDQIIKAVAENGAAAKLGDGRMDEILNDLGVACVGAITAAFGSRGFGSWRANKPSTVRRKGSSQPLIDTGQLRRSITYEVTKA